MSVGFPFYKCKNSCFLYPPPSLAGRTRPNLKQIRFKLKVKPWPQTHSRLVRLFPAVPSFRGSLLQQSKKLPCGSPEDHLQCNPPISRRRERRARAGRTISRQFYQVKSNQFALPRPFLLKISAAGEEADFKFLSKELEIRNEVIRVFSGVFPQDVGQDDCPLIPLGSYICEGFFFFNDIINLVIRRK